MEEGVWRGGMASVMTPPIRISGTPISVVLASKRPAIRAKVPIIIRLGRIMKDIRIF
ncbi:hypothetical protein GCM10007315_19380 [Gemmobacter tilapiae]|uniref:Uncharacterized protein n=1 Tax=Neogemmobacter tilapiae TaxID=875041 RepID=A0A918TTS2_9RHOB|nr:hypothetical protein GCM10007315_19380 [Gemmobacter tilapiae]